MPSFGTLKADTLTHSTAGSLATNFVVQGSAKAWVHGNSDATIDESLNTSSGTDNGTGNYTFTYTNSMSTANHVSVGSTRTSSDQSTTMLLAAASTNIYSYDISSHSLEDRDPLFIAAGDLA
jgi:hypothetical protein